MTIDAAAAEAKVVEKAESATKAVEKKVTTAKRTVKRKTAATTAKAKTTARKTAKKIEKQKVSINELFSEAKLKETREKMKEQAEKMSDVMKNVVYLQLGVCGKIYDEVSSLVEKRKKKASEQWDTLVSRGEKVQKELEKSQTKLSKKVKSFDLNKEIKDGVSKVKDGYKDAVSKVKDFAKTKKAA